MNQWLLISLPVYIAFQLPRQHYRLFNRRDLFRLALACLAIILLALGLTFVSAFKGIAPKSGAIVLAGLLTGMFWTGFRLCVAEVSELRSAIQRLRSDHTSRSEQVLIVGAGRSGLLILQELVQHPELGQRVVGFVDDAKEKLSIRIQGLPVLGTSGDLPALLARHPISLVILAIPSASGTVLRRLTRIVSDAGVRVKTVPGLFNLLGSQTWSPEIKDVAIEDLLRRDPVSLDQSALSQAIEDSVVLITGGGGSIGSELARQVASFRPARLVLLGRGENSLWDAERNLRALFPTQGLAIELCDIRDPVRLQQTFARWKPEIVLHAAAHKHVPYLERHCAEGVQNNVLGTLNVVRAAEAVRAHTLVNISTDKAVNPVNVLGATKFLAECILLEAAGRALPPQRFVSVRFGNVLGSRGSVLPVFKEQIQRGGPLTVTHPDMTRYFMTIPEASQLALQAGILGGNGKVFVLDMGEPVRIVDLATDMAHLSGLTVGQDIEIQFSGVRPGEKLFEETFLEGEEQQSGVHPKILEGAGRPLEPDLLREGIAALTRAIALPEGDRQREILRLFRLLVPQYRPSPSGLGRFAPEADAPPRSIPEPPGIQ
ncbi:MAG: nucleoside-diphosphate sugar epimerase/dehydratase [Holophaga sp.]|nr:nucleoside-diphosphate sugar epimerase/dehydratase [Holophaga sp.]